MARARAARLHVLLMFSVNLRPEVLESSIAGADCSIVVESLVGLKLSLTLAKAVSNVRDSMLPCSVYTITPAPKLPVSLFRNPSFSILAAFSLIYNPPTHRP